MTVASSLPAASFLRPFPQSLATPRESSSIFLSVRAKRLNPLPGPLCFRVSAISRR